MAAEEIEREAAGSTALIIIDMINDLDFESGADMLPKALEAGDAILRLREQADAAGVPTVYVNDHYGMWHSERSRLIEHALASGGKLLVEKLQPRHDDYFVIKPQFSGFYSTNLPVLLPKLGASRLILTGIAADICVLFTAADAHMRDYDLWVPGDCVVSRNDQRTRWALDIMRDSMHAETRPTSEFALDAWVKEGAGSRIGVD